MLCAWAVVTVYPAIVESTRIAYRLVLTFVIFATFQGPSNFHNVTLNLGNDGTNFRDIAMGSRCGPTPW